MICMEKLDSIGEHGERVARRVQMERERQGLTFAELSRKTDGKLDSLALRRIEGLARRIDLDALFLLSKGLGVSVWDLLEVPEESVVVEEAVGQQLKQIQQAKAEWERQVEQFQAMAREMGIDIKDNA